MAGTKENKERVLHTRVPEALEAQIKALAEALRVPVSSLVRNILEDSVEALEAAAARGLSEVQAKLAEHRRARGGSHDRHDFGDVIGWQRLSLNQSTNCVRCGQALGVGESAHLAVRERGGARTIVCTGCVPQQERNET